MKIIKRRSLLFFASNRFIGSVLASFFCFACTNGPSKIESVVTNPLHTALPDTLFKNDSVQSKVKGDLNKDGIEDFVYIIQLRDSVYHTKEYNEYMGVVMPKSLVVMLSDKATKTFSVYCKNDSLFKDEEGEDYEGKFETSIEKGKLYIDHASYLGIGSYQFHTRYTFLLRDGHFKLIGADYNGWVRTTGENYNVSANFLTKKYSVAKGDNYMEDEPEPTWHKITHSVSYNLEDMPRICDLILIKGEPL
jgi:hypothetical protein